MNRIYSYYPNSNRLRTNDKYTFYYDNNGNMIKKVNEADDWEYEYDLLDRLIKVSKNGTSVAEYTYNAGGLRLKKENSEQEIYYIYNLSGQIIYEQENARCLEYIYVRGNHFAMVDTDRTTGESSTYFYHTDHLGSTVLVTDVAGAIVWTAEYTPFGSISMAEGMFEKAVKFTGKDLDLDTGLYYYNARWYDSEIGRFISEDTYQGELNNPQTLNLYIYVQNNPLIYVDPSGHKEFNFGDETVNSALGTSLLPGDEPLALDFEVTIWTIDFINPMNLQTLRYGQDNFDTIKLQKGLNKVGYPTDVDGIFGSDTMAKVKEFQRANGLDADGIVGSKTKAALAKVLGIEVEEVNPDRKEVIVYITQKAEELGIPVALALATAQTESEMLHFEEYGENRGKVMVNNGDWGIMQINQRWHPEAFTVIWGDIGNNWQDNISYGLHHLTNCYNSAIKLDNQEWGQQGLDLGSAKMGNNTSEENLARAAYALYNTGNEYYRYRLTKSEAEALDLSVGVYGLLDKHGYDIRDINFWNNYNKFKN